MGKSQKHKVLSNKFTVSVQYPYNIYGTSVDERIVEAAGHLGSWNTWGNNRSVLFYYLDEHEAVGIVSRVLALGIEDLQANAHEDEQDDIDEGDGW